MNRMSKRRQRNVPFISSNLNEICLHPFNTPLVMEMQVGKQVQSSMTRELSD
jgi:hypothetical protein